MRDVAMIHPEKNKRGEWKMKRICIDENWTFRKGLLDSPGMLKDDPGTTVNLPHDGMISTPVRPSQLTLALISTEQRSSSRESERSMPSIRIG